MLEFPKPISPIPEYNGVSVSQKNSIAMPASIIDTLMPKKSLGDMERRKKAPRKHPAVRNMK